MASIASVLPAADGSFFCAGRHEYVVEWLHWILSCVDKYNGYKMDQPDGRCNARHLGSVGYSGNYTLKKKLFEQEVYQESNLLIMLSDKYQKEK